MNPTKYDKKYQPQFDVFCIPKNKNVSYLSVYGAFDSETAWNHNEENPIAWVYQWALRIGEDKVCGRCPSEFIDALKKLEKYVKDTGARLIIFVHNLSYDLTYFFPWITKNWSDYDYLCTDSHKIITFTFSCFELRCSWKLSNRSLEKWGNDFQTFHRKKVGFVDYSIIRYPDDVLSKNDWVYMWNDVDTLYDCLEEQLRLYGDTTATIPLTATAYVRRDCFKFFRQEKKNAAEFQKTKLTPQVYKMALNEFAGALAHGNRFLAEKTIRVDERKGVFIDGYKHKEYKGITSINHRDFRSHYPSQQRVREFPVGRFVKYKEHADFSDIKKLSEKHCCLFDIILQNVELKNKEITMPSLSKAFCERGKKSSLSIIDDNGRVLKMTGITRLTMTEIDLQVFLSQYKVEYYDIPILFVSIKDSLPVFMIRTVDEYMKNKTKYKDLERRETDPDKKLDYAKSLMIAKNGLNGIYGMSAQKIVRDDFELDSEGFFSKVTLDALQFEEKMEAFYKNKRSFMRYVWGCWTTSYARKELIDFCSLIGYKNIIYGDTDSLFYFSNKEIEKRIEEKNKDLEKTAIEKGAFIEYDGKKITYDVFEKENEKIVSFRFLHSKCYAYEKEEDRKKVLKCTIAGVVDRVVTGLDADEKPIYFTRENELEKIENLETGFVFKTCGGTRSTYITRQPQKTKIGDHVVEVSNACIIQETEKTLKNVMEKIDGTFDYWQK